MNATTTISRNIRGELRAKSVFPLGFDARELHIETGKSSPGVTCSATVFRRTADGMGLEHAFGFGAPGGDFRRTLKTDPKARATEKTLSTMHAACLVDLPALMVAACAHYGKPAPAAETAAPAQALAA